MRSLLGVVEEVDSFPYYHDQDPAQYQSTLESLFKLCIFDASKCYAYLPEALVRKIPWTSRFEISAEEKRITLAPSSSKDKAWADASAEFSKVTETMRQQQLFPRLREPCEEFHAILGTDSQVKIARDAQSIFSIVTQGCHMNVFTYSAGGIKVWVARRSSLVNTYPGMLDNAVAGGLSVGETPFECIVREAEEEASLAKEYVEKNTRPCGTLSWFTHKGETCQPGLQYVFDLQVDETVELKPLDGEVEAFHLWDMMTVRDSILMGEFKPSCALVLIDFFIRHGYITAENESYYAEIISRIHRRLPFPVTG